MKRKLIYIDVTDLFVFSPFFLFMARRMDTRRRDEGYSNKMMGLKLQSEGGSVSGVSQTGFSQSGSQKTSSSLEYMKPPDTAFDVRAGKEHRTKQP